MNSCHIPNTHKRLLEAHRLWHQCLSNYFDPEGFRTNLNATIQSLRNLTFALQAEQKGIPEFDEWYPTWQERIKADKVMKWLNDARVEIVHRRDLETKSIAVVKVHGYYDIAELTLNVYPFLSSEAITKYTKEKILENSNQLQANIIEECVAVVERKWVVDDLPDWELLNAVRHCFILLCKLVNDAHNRCGAPVLSCQIIDTLHPLSEDELSSGAYTCMQFAQNVRTSQILLSDFSTVRIKKMKLKPDEKLMMKSAKRYSLGASVFKKLDPDQDFLSYAANINNVALEVLKKDKYHRSIFFMHVPNQGWQLYSTDTADKTEKFIIMSTLAEQVKVSRADCIITINEAWISNDLEAIKQGIPVVETMDRKEALQVTLASSNGIRKVFTTLFRRSVLGKIILEETIITEDDVLNYLQPIFKVWNELENLPSRDK